MSLVSTGHTPLYPPGWLVGQLPMGMREDDFFVRFATIFERVAETVRAGADSVDFIADPAVTALPMLAYLGTWMGVDLVDPRLEPEAQRKIVRTLGSTLTRRGTAAALTELLEALTGSPVQVVDPGAVISDEPVPTSHPVQIHLTSCGHLRPQEIEAIIRDEVPVHIAVEIHLPQEGIDR
jgi:phage tail-like protein